MSTPHPHGPHEDNPLTAMLVSLSGASGPGHETGPPGANEQSVRAGHEPDRFRVRNILYVPAAVVAVLALAYLLVTGLFSVVMSGEQAELAKARQQNPLATAEETTNWNKRAGQISSTNPEPLDQPSGTAQPRREHLYQTLNKAGGPDPEFYRSKLPDPEGNNPIAVRPEDLRPENYVGHYFDPVKGEKVLATYGWADAAHTLARVPVNEAIKMVAAGKLTLPVRKDPITIPETTVGRARMSNAGRGGKPPFPVPVSPSPNTGEGHKEHKHPEKK
ncbi:MAG TPA: hypothetical protein VFG68_02390 [Fimbriiglobus sp.]|nr:hypothetical protein [Fimbriiglobus sp.]